jgi:tetratricopeptide (TPR) repeat protein
MDPITRASKQFLMEAAAHWKAAKGHVLFVAAEARFRGDLVKTLRLAEASPSCRRPLFLFEGAFVEEGLFFSELEASLVADYEALRKGAAEEGVSLAGLEGGPRAGESSLPASDPGKSLPRDVRQSLPRAGARAREIAAALAGGLDGIDVALVPKQVASPEAYSDAVARAAGELAAKAGGVRLLVWAPPGGALSKMTDGRTAHFRVDEAALAEHLRNMGNDSEGKTLRGLLLSAAEATGKGEHAEASLRFGEARRWCRARELVVEEAGVLVALAGCQLAAGETEDAAHTYREASLLAGDKGALPLAAQAALGEGAVRLQQKRYPDAVVAYRAAGALAQQAKIPLLQVEALRMEGTAALATGHRDVALAAWKKALDAGCAMDAASLHASTWEDVVNALTAFLRKHGMAAQARSVESQAEALRSGAVAAGAAEPARSPTAGAAGQSGAPDPLRDA